MENFEEKKVVVTRAVSAKVWKHWKPEFKKHKWPLAGAFLFYSATMCLDTMIKPITWKNSFDELIRHGNPWGSFRIAVVITAISWVLSRLGETSIILAEARILKGLKDSILSGLMGKSMHFFSTHSSGGLVAKAKRFASVSEHVIDEFVFTISRSILLVVYIMSFTVVLVPVIAPLFGGWIVLFLAVVIPLSHFRTKYDLESSNADSLTTGHLSDVLLSVFTLRIFSATPRYLDTFQEKTQDERRKRLISWFLGNLQWAIQGFLVVALELSCMHYMLAEVEQGRQTVGSAILVQSYIATLTMFMWNFGRSFIKVRTSLADAYEMAELLDEPSPEPITYEAVPHSVSSHSIELKNITFGYDSENAVLRDFSFLFKEGRSYGVIGKTGSGKSTIMKLIMRFYNPGEGEISLGGESIKSIQEHTLRSNISYVSQNQIFPSCTIRDVISLGNPFATEDQIIAAAKKASCDFIWEKHDGLDTVIGERGVKLSGGEAQRLAIAAAILKDAPIVIMDEPTSALDAITEQSIQRALQTHFQGKTLIVIAHRLATVAILDEIVLLEQGKIADCGSHEDLLQSSGVYKEMWDLQTNPQVFVHE